MNEVSSASSGDPNSVDFTSNHSNLGLKYLVSWLSPMGSVVGLHLDKRYSLIYAGELFRKTGI